MALLFRFAAAAFPTEGGVGAYAALVFDASYSDREIGSRLAGSAFGNSFISESLQTVYLDNFGELEAIPLDEWAARLEDFDPRRDGYAEKLSAFFVRNGKRLFFVSLSEEMAKLDAVKLEAGFAAALGDIPFEAEFLIYDNPVAFYFMLFGAAAFLAVALSRSPWITLPLAPLFSGFAFIGSPGFVLAGILLVVAGALVGQLRELFAATRYGDAKTTVLARFNNPLFGTKRTRLKIRALRAKPLGLLLSLALFLLFGALYVYIGLSYEVPLMFLVAVFASECVILLLTLWAESKRGTAQDHIRFTPVPILRNTSGFPVFTRAIIPFALAAYLALVLPDTLGLVTYRESRYLGDTEHLIAEDDYEAHITFQSSFSFTPLDGERDGDYTRYYLGDDGLITGTKTYRNGQFRRDGILPFSLEGLMDFLQETGSNERTASSGGVDIGGLFLIAPLIFPCLFVT